MTPESQDVVRRELTSADIPVFAPVVDAFYNFGGYWVPSGRNRTFRIHPVRDAVANLRYAGTKSDAPDQFRITFGEHPTAQMWFTMDGFGRLFTDDTMVADTLAQWIESLALHEMVDRWKHSTRIVFPEDSTPEIRKWADQNLRRFAPASSRSSAWWLHPQAAIHIFTPWSSGPNASKWTWCFATTPTEADDLTDRIRRSIGIEAMDVCSWPP